MPGSPDFKSGASGGKAFPLSNPHDHCFKCLGKEHRREKCKICRAFKPRTQKDQGIQLKAVLMEAALRPASEPPRSTSVPSVSSVQSAPPAPTSTRCREASPAPGKKKRQRTERRHSPAPPVRAGSNVEMHQPRHVESSLVPASPSREPLPTPRSGGVPPSTLEAFQAARALLALLTPPLPSPQLREKGLVSQGKPTLGPPEGRWRPPAGVERSPAEQPSGVERGRSQYTWSSQSPLRHRSRSPTLEAVQTRRHRDSSHSQSPVPKRLLATRRRRTRSPSRERRTQSPESGSAPRSSQRHRSRSPKGKRHRKSSVPRRRSTTSSSSEHTSACQHRSRRRRRSSSSSTSEVSRGRSPARSGTKGQRRARHHRSSGLGSRKGGSRGDTHKASRHPHETPQLMPQPAPGWPRGQWPQQWPYWGPWCVQMGPGPQSVLSLGVQTVPPALDKAHKDHASDEESDPGEGPSTGAPGRQGGDQAQVAPWQSSSPDEAASRDHMAPLRDFRAHQELLKRVASNLRLEVKELVEDDDTLFNVLGAEAPARVALPVHDSVLKIAKALWQTPASVAPTSKGAEKKYYVPAEGFEFLFTHPAPGTLVVDAANQWDRQGHPGSTPRNKDNKKLDLFGRKVYSTAALQFRIANHQALLGRYNFNLWDCLRRFAEALPQDQAADFAIVLDEGISVARAALQMSRDAADSASRAMASAIAMRRCSWLQSSGLSQEVQQSIQDLPFDGSGLFSGQTDAKLHSLKDSRATLRSLGLYTPQASRQQSQPHMQQQPRPLPRPSQPYRGSDRNRGFRRRNQPPSSSSASQQGPPKGSGSQKGQF
ncbi:serine/arginine repetitive matrix protein 1-like isoform X1 [Emydura macquarii macquarii]|uniref:serine/arginine repetitive matrix protein 1-like isoform X1 n=1 Tax=Emydura macquarii macquarii TaxID=1129001 RepID=UPI00352A4B71